MRRSALALVLVGLFVPAALNAQIDTRGKVSLQAAGFGTVQDGNTTATALAGLSYFATKGFEVGGDVSTTITTNSEGDTNTDGFLTARLRYNFVGQSLFVPYVSLGLGTGLNPDVTVTTSNAGAGFKRFINERVSVNGEVNYTSMSFSSDFGDFENDAINFLVGIAIYTGN